MCVCVGCARTEGYYKISYQEKCNYLCHARGVSQNDVAGVVGEEQWKEPDASSQARRKCNSLARRAVRVGVGRVFCVLSGRTAGTCSSSTNLKYVLVSVSVVSLGGWESWSYRRGGDTPEKLLQFVCRNLLVANDFLVYPMYQLVEIKLPLSS